MSTKITDAWWHRSPPIISFIYLFIERKISQVTLTAFTCKYIKLHESDLWKIALRGCMKAELDDFCQVCAFIQPYNDFSRVKRVKTSKKTDLTELFLRRWHCFCGKIIEKFRTCLKCGRFVESLFNAIN